MEGGARSEILVKAPNWLGDLVLFTPALRALCRIAGGSRVCVVGNAVARDVAALSQLDLEFVYFDRHGPARRHADCSLDEGRRGGEGMRVSDLSCDGGWRGALSVLRAKSWDVGITFAEGFSSALLLRLAGVRRLLGYRGDGKGMLLSVALPRKELGKRPHLAEEYLALAQEAGAIPDGAVPHLPTGESLRAGARDALKRSGLDPSRSIVGLCPGAAYGPSKQWPADRFISVGLELGRLGLGIVVFGSRSEVGLAGDVARAIPGAVSMAGKTSVRSLAALLAQCGVVIANDSGAAHLAAAVGAPVVALFASSDPSWTRPLGQKVRIIQSHVECAPCFRRECDIGYPCLTEMTPALVVKTALSLAEGPEKGSFSI